jgi:hypothetical protein
MKQFILAICLLITVSLFACTTPQITSTVTATPNTNDEGEVRNLIENFGKRLQAVALLAPDAAEEIKDQYSEFVSPTLLAEWTQDVSKAPGRKVSSPWPDHIEITSLKQAESDRYVMSGFVIEITSVEVVNGGAAAKIPVRVVVQRVQDHWLITEYAEKQ